MNKSDVSALFEDWGDYMEWSKELKHEIRSKYVLFPKNLKLAHDRVMEEHRLYQKKRKRAEVQRGEKKGEPDSKGRTDSVRR